MDAVEALRLSAQMAYGELEDALADISEAKSWACVQPVEGEYLHTAGSILSIVQHIGLCKYGYGCCAFTGCEPRGRETLAQVREIGTDWERTKSFLRSSHQFWMLGWAGLTGADLTEEYGTIWNNQWPAWKLIARVTQHDQYHAGQINMLRTILEPADTPPDLRLDEEEVAFQRLHFW